MSTILDSFSILVAVITSTRGFVTDNLSRVFLTLILEDLAHVVFKNVITDGSGIQGNAFLFTD